MFFSVVNSFHVTDKCCITSSQWKHPSNYHNHRRISYLQSSKSKDADTTFTGNRRNMLEIICHGTLALTIIPYISGNYAAYAEVAEEGKIIAKKSALRPFAPLEALLPATRVKLLIDRSYSVTKELLLVDRKKDDVVDNEIKLKLVTQLKGFLLEENYDFQKKEYKQYNSRTTSQGSAGPSKMYSESYREQMNGIPIAQKPLALLTQAGDYRQNRILRRRQNKLEQDNAIRAALNSYTKALQFDSKNYLLTASPMERKRLIRTQGTVPDVKSVIISDLDLRDLYRNQILTLWEDARAEFRYQLTNVNEQSVDKENMSFSTMDVKDLLEILKETKQASDSWFSFISEKDILEALAVVSSEVTGDA